MKPDSMKKNWLMFAIVIFLMLGLLSSKMYAQPATIKDLYFLIGTWEAEEQNKEKNWSEKCTRVGTYVLDSTYIQLESVAVSSTGKKRGYRFLIHYNSAVHQFEMVSIYSNWPKMQHDILDWNTVKRALTIRSKPEEGDYAERIGTMQFNEDFTTYKWAGINKSGDRMKPNIWEYQEIGKRIK
jgi:hypothetical protein